MYEIYLCKKCLFLSFMNLIIKSPAEKKKPTCLRYLKKNNWQTTFFKRSNEKTKEKNKLKTLL